jgi:capsular exopolysaccharide synthesis family protein
MSQEIQLLHQGLPLQPGMAPQVLAASSNTEPTPFRRIHQLLRGRYLLAGILAGIGAVCGLVAGVVLPKPAWESIAVVKVNPVVPQPGVQDGLKTLYTQYLANALIELHTDRLIRQAMQSDEWRAHRPYAGVAPSPEDVAEFSKNLTVKQMPLAQEMIQVIYDDNRKDAKDVAQVAVKSVILAFKSLWGDGEGQEVDQKIQYHERAKTALELEVSADQNAIHELTKEVGDDDNAVVGARMANLIALEREVRQARQHLEAATRDRDRRRAGLNGSQAYTAEEIARVDLTMLGRLNARNESQILYQDLLAQYGAAYPKVIEQKRLMELRQQLIDDAVKTFNDEYFIEQRSDGGPGLAVPKDLSKLQMVLDELTTAYKSEDAQIKEILSRHAKITEYRSDIDLKRTQIVEKSRLIENLNYEKAWGATFSVVDEGSAAAPAADRRPVFAALGFLGGAAVPVGFLLLVGLANPRYRFSDEAHSDLNGLNLLGILPDLPDRLSDPEQASIAAHCVHQIRTMLQISGSPNERRVFAITSAAPGDGKTSLTLALGLSYAACGARTLLIDCDLIGAGLTARMNVSSPAGVLEAIANRSLPEYVRSTDVADVTILPVGSAQTLHASTLSPAALRRLIDEARKQYDTILIDTGPILGSIEASLVCAAADAVVLTVARGQQRPLVEKAIARLMGIGAKLAGVVFNRAQSGDFDRSISGASSHRSQAAGNGHNGKDQPRYGTLGRAIRTQAGHSEVNEG